MEEQFFFIKPRLAAVYIFAVLIGILAIYFSSYRHHGPSDHSGQFRHIAPSGTAETGYSQARVRPGGSRGNHVGPDNGDRLKLCDEPGSNNCNGHRYLVPGDIMLASKVKGRFVYVDFVNRNGKSSAGWVDRDRIERMPTEVSKQSRWLGLWRADDYFIKVTSSKADGYLIAEGAGTWGLDDPERAKNGTISLGEFAAKFIVKDDRAAFAVDDYDDAEPGLKFKDSQGVAHKMLPWQTSSDTICKISLQRLGIYLVVDDNGRCGGENFTFSGVYRNFGE